MLLEFVRDSSYELKWLNEKEEEELTRNWNATTMSAEVITEHFQVKLLQQLQTTCMLIIYMKGEITLQTCRYISFSGKDKRSI